MKTIKIKSIITEELTKISESLEYLEKQYPEYFQELNALDDKKLQAEITRLDSEYEDKRKYYRYDDEEVQKLYNKYYVGKEILVDRHNKKVEKNINALIGLKFIDSTITEIGFPDETGGEFDTFKIYLEDDSDFEYKADKKFPSFKYFKYFGKDKESIFIRQDLTKRINPNEAILTTNDLKVLNLIVKAYNSRYTELIFGKSAGENKMPLPPVNTVTKDGTKTYDIPVYSSADFQWMVGMGSTEEKIKSVDVKVSPSTYDKSFSVSMSIRFEDNDNIFRFKSMYYYAYFNEFHKLERESFTENHFGDKEGQEIKYLGKDVYEPIMKAIQQINPKSKYLKTVGRSSLR